MRHISGIPIQKSRCRLFCKCIQVSITSTINTENNSHLRTRRGWKTWGFTPVRPSFGIFLLYTEVFHKKLREPKFSSPEILDDKNFRIKQEIVKKNMQITGLSWQQQLLKEYHRKISQSLPHLKSTNEILQYLITCRRQSSTVRSQQYKVLIKKF